MQTNPLTSISPIDGRYRNKTEKLYPYFSESGLIKYRILIEIEYFIALVDLPLPELKSFDKSLFPELRALYKNFSLEEAQKIKNIEKETNHDVKAVEYYLKEEFQKLGINQYKEFIHFGLTSQDINNTATPLSLKDAIEDVYLPILKDLTEKFKTLSETWKEIPMLARTHGQPASPTRLGKEIKVFHERLTEQLKQLSNTPFSAKFGGATGNFNAHHVAYADIDWHGFAQIFVNQTLRLHRSQTTTQIEHYDNISALFQTMGRINTILIDFSRDIWSYISMNYFKQNIVKGEVGSSAMPHKVNPIDFENAEGNLGVANAMYHHLATKLPISRLQRDLTDSTVLRNIGVPISHSIIAFQSINKGIDKLKVNEEAIYSDLEKNWLVIAEAIQTILRKEGYENPYELLKELTRKNKTITHQDFIDFINSLSVDNQLKEKLKKITPFNYTGL